LIFQIGTSSWGGTRKLPYAFTENGVAMLSSVLHSDHAISVNIQIIRIFTKLRQLLESHKEIILKINQLQQKEIEQDKQIRIIFEVLKQLQRVKQEDLDFKNRKRIGYKT